MTALFTPTVRVPEYEGILAALSLSSSLVRAHEQISEGLPVSIIREAANKAQLDEGYLLRLVGVDRSTYHRRLKHPEKTWSVEQGARIYASVRVLDAAARLFDRDYAKAVDWLNQPAKALGGQPPAAMLKTPAGTEAVLDLIGRIGHGVIS
ncbi:antitoxin Xre/MbcA/ParS toxin-binding domain-containing protein [Dickeya dianthicola]|uniref:type II RES/Xre toxin-antitoxin system antitoxin n=1 Tax=Dickeya dianthicola TaxID=204039 RepID=UPI0030162386